MSLLEEYGNRKEQKGWEEGIKEGKKIMTLLKEYGNRKEQKGKDEGMKEIIYSLIESGTPLTEISQKTGKSINELKENP